VVARIEGVNSDTNRPVRLPKNDRRFMVRLEWRETGSGSIGKGNPGDPSFQENIFL
jgi:hypothetical protein